MLCKSNRKAVPAPVSNESLINYVSGVTLRFKGREGVRGTYRAWAVFAGIFKAILQKSMQHPWGI